MTKKEKKEFIILKAINKYHQLKFPPIKVIGLEKIPESSFAPGKARETIKDNVKL
jgi:hypothetical protein